MHAAAARILVWCAVLLAAVVVAAGAAGVGEPVGQAARAAAQGAAEVPAQPEGTSQGESGEGDVELRAARVGGVVLREPRVVVLGAVPAAAPRVVGRPDRVPLAAEGVLVSRCVVLRC
jgi:hypothetical protein